MPIPPDDKPPPPQSSHFWWMIAIVGLIVAGVLAYWLLIFDSGDPARRLIEQRIEQEKR
jgi:hypothetical protein